MPTEWERVGQKKREVRKPLPKITPKTMLVDVHEPKTIHRLLKKNKIPFSVRYMAYGDYRIGNAVAERKTIFDFVASVRSERVFKQLEAIPNECTKWLVICGGMEELLSNERYSGVNRQGVFGAIGSCMTRYFANVLWGTEIEVIPVMYKMLLKTAEGNLGVPRRHRIRKVTQSRTGDTIRELLRLDPKTADELVVRARRRKMGVLKYIMGAPDSELILVSGIGRVTLKRIREVIG